MDHDGNGSDHLLWEVEKENLLLRRRLDRLTEQQARQERIAHAQRELLKNALQELEQAKEQAEAASRAKSDFLARIGHELRTPLNALLGMSEVLSGSELDESQRRGLEVIRGSGETLLRLIDDVLEAAALETGRFKLNPRSFDPAAVCRACLDAARRDARIEDLDLRLEIGDGPEVKVHGDDVRIRQILANLLHNAVKFTERGEVRLQLDREQFEGGVRLAFTVSDTGPGIPEDQQERIFESFTQAAEFLDRSRGGAGLGLAIARQLAELMGGKLTLRSTPGEGSEFRLEVDLPTARPEASPRLDKPVRLLLVDDHDMSRETALELLKGSADAVTAKDGREGLEAFCNGTFDLVLMDLSMPVMDGRDAARAMREWEAEQGLAPTPIVALSAHARAEEAAASLESGFDEHVVKPVSREKLEKLLQRFAGG
jgi:signal transduction histidine kinase